MLRSSWNSMIPLPMVLATLSSLPHRTGSAEMKLKKAAQPTATTGERTRVETTVAMEFAASWKPLMKSKASATSTSPMTTATSIGPLGVLQDDALDDVGHVLGPVDGVLDQVEDLLPLHDREG